MKIVIVGAGEVGFHIANRLALENKNVVVIDKNPDALRRVADNIDVQVIQGSGSNPSILEEAGIREANIMLAVTNQDETNLVACVVTDIISPSTKKIARIRNADFDKYHDTLRYNPPHIDTVINPEIEVVKTIDRLMTVPGAVEVGEFANGLVKVVGINLEENSRLRGLRLLDLPSVIQKSRPLIAAIVRDDQLIIPRGDDVLLHKDLIYFTCEVDKLTETLSVFDKIAHPVKRVLIIGGGRIAIRLASLLEKKSIYTKIIEKDQKRCAELAKRLDKTIVLHGDGSDHQLLMEENVSDADFVVSLTNDEETNILTSLLVQRMGAKKTITKISKFSYMPLMSALGMHMVVNPRLSAINSILQYVRKGKVLSAMSIKGEQGEVIEAVALATSQIVGKPLKNVPFPKGALIVGIIRGDKVTIPSGESIINPDDRIIIFSTRQAIPKIEKFLTVKLEFF
ncbi:MAG: Trk system potassium transporter TrkA [Desulfobacterales bacterium]|nr:Trk system potassium transporter TrkA [Desulfobacterales bacterium]